MQGAIWAITLFLVYGSWWASYVTCILYRFSKSPVSKARHDRNVVNNSICSIQYRDLGTAADSAWNSATNQDVWSAVQ